MNWLSMLVFAQAEMEDPMGGAAELDPAAAAAAMGVLAVAGLVGAVVGILTIAGMWASFAKAGKPGWASIIPIYNTIVMLEIAGKPIWWLILMLIPCVGVIVAILALMAFAKNFGKSEAYGLGLAFLPFLFFPMLGFGKATYQPVAQAT